MQSALDGAATSADVANLLAVINDIGEDVQDLINKSVFINQNISIDNSATLEYWEAQIHTGADDPNVIVNGYVIINAQGFTVDEKARINAITSKIGLVLDYLQVFSLESIPFPNLGYVDGDLNLSGAVVDAPALRVIFGNLNLASMSGGLSFSQATTVVGDINMDAGTAYQATSVDFSGIAFNSISVAGFAQGELEFPNATSVRIDGPVRLLRAENAASIDLGMTSTSSGLNVYGGDTTIVHIDSLTTVSNLEIVANEAHLPSLTSAGTIDIQVNAAVDLSSLATINNPIDLNTCLSRAVGLFSRVE